MGLNLQEQLMEIEAEVLTAPGATIRIMRNPYNDSMILVSAAGVGEAAGNSLLDALSKFADLLNHAAPEVHIEDAPEVVDPKQP